MTLIKDEHTGELRPYDPDLDYDTPLSQFGQIPPDPTAAKAAPLNPLKDFK